MIGEASPRLTIRQDLLIIGLAMAGALAAVAGIVYRSPLYFVPLIVLPAIPIVAKWPIACSLGVYAFLIPFDSIVVLGEGSTGPTLTRLVGAMAVGIMLIVAMVGRRFTPPPRATFWWFMFTLWGGVSVLWALDPQIVLDRIPTSVSLFLVYLVAVSIRENDRELSSVCTLLVIGGTLAAGYSLYAYNQGVFYQDVSGRASLIMGERETDPNQFAASLLLPLGLAVAGVLGTRQRPVKALYVTAVFTICGSLYLTMSRGTLVALGVMILAYLIRVKVDWRFGTLVLGLLIMTVIMPDLFFERIAMIGESGGAGRVDIWTVGIHSLAEFGALGAGLSNFPLAYNLYAGFAPVFRGYWRGAHNIYLGTWVELGIVGIGTMIAALWSHVRSIGGQHDIRNTRRGIYLIATECACYGTLASGFFLDIVWRKAFWFPWILLALCVQGGRMMEKGRKG